MTTHQKKILNSQGEKCLQRQRSCDIVLFLNLHVSVLYSSTPSLTPLHLWNTLIKAHASDNMISIAVIYVCANTFQHTLSNLVLLIIIVIFILGFGFSNKENIMMAFQLRHRWGHCPFISNREASSPFISSCPTLNMFLFGPGFSIEHHAQFRAMIRLRKE